MKITVLGRTLEAKEPKVCLEPVLSERVVVWTGQEIQVSLWVPSQEGMAEYRVWIKDDPDGWDKHLAEQARLLGQEPPLSVVFSGFKVKRCVQIAYREDGGEWREVRIPTDREDLHKLVFEFLDEWAKQQVSAYLAKGCKTHD